MVQHPRHNNALCLMLLRQLLVEHFGYDDVNFTQAPPVYTLERFGGPFTIEKFREFSKRKILVVEHTPRLMVCNLAFELLYEQKKKNESEPAAAPLPIKKIKKKLTMASNHPETIHENETAEANDDKTDLLDNVDVIKADSVNRWEIMNLKRPEKSIPTQSQNDGTQAYYKGSNSVSLFSEFISDKNLEQKIQEFEDSSKKKGRKKTPQPKAQPAQAPQPPLQEPVQQRTSRRKPRTAPSPAPAPAHQEQPPAQIDPLNKRGSLDFFLV